MDFRNVFSSIKSANASSRDLRKQLSPFVAENVNETALRVLYNYKRGTDPRGALIWLKHSIFELEDNDIVELRALKQAVLISEYEDKRFDSASIRSIAENLYGGKEAKSDLKEECLIISLLSLVKNTKICGVTINVFENSAEGNRNIICAWSKSRWETKDRIDWIIRVSKVMRKTQKHLVEIVIIPNPENHAIIPNCISFCIKNILEFQCRIEGEQTDAQKRKITTDMLSRGTEKDKMYMNASMTQKNFLIVGSMGSGKSTLVNILKDEGEEAAFVNHSGVGTFQIDPYSFLSGCGTLWDTPGTNDEFDSDETNLKRMENLTKSLQHISGLLFLSSKGRDLKNSDIETIRRYKILFGTEINSLIAIIIGMDKLDRNIMKENKIERMKIRFGTMGIQICEDNIFFIRAALLGTESEIPKDSLQELERLRSWCLSNEKVFTEEKMNIALKVIDCIERNNGLVPEDLFAKIKKSNELLLEMIPKKIESCNVVKIDWKKQSLVFVYISWKKTAFGKQKSEFLYNTELIFDRVEDFNKIKNLNIRRKGMPSSSTWAIRIKNILQEILMEDLVFFMVKSLFKGNKKKKQLDEEYVVFSKERNLNLSTKEKVIKFIQEQGSVHEE